MIFFRSRSGDSGWLHWKGPPLVRERARSGLITPRSGEPPVRVGELRRVGLAASVAAGAAQKRATLLYACASRRHGHGHWQRPSGAHHARFRRLCARFRALRRGHSATLAARAAARVQYTPTNALPSQSCQPGALYEFWKMAKMFMILMMILFRSGSGNSGSLHPKGPPLGEGSGLGVGGLWFSPSRGAS